MVKRLQNGHGGWKEFHNELLGKPIVIQYFDMDGDIVAVLEKMRRLGYIHPKATVKADDVQCRDDTWASVDSVVQVS